VTVSALLLSRGNRPVAPPAGIVHLGLGNFHRAHQAVYTAAAQRLEPGNWGIVGVANRSGSVVDAMRAQDLLYTVVQVSPEGAEFSVPGIHTDAYVGAQDPARVVADLADRSTRIASLTVTEHGYSYSPSTGHLAVEDPVVAADLAAVSSGSAAPRSVVGQLVAAVRDRAAGHGEPLTILSCDNLSGNGDHTRRLVVEFAQHCTGPDDVLAFLDTRVCFPNSMVDRIVPSTTDAYRALVARECGYRDEVPVPAEPFTQWVLEDRFAAGRPAWDVAGAVFSDEVHGYEELKLRLLNGTHSLIAYLGVLSGCPTIPDSVARPEIRAAARSVLREEYLPSVQVPAGVDVDAYERELFSRWDNSALGHRSSQVAGDGSVKLRQRVPEPALLALREGRFPHHLALTVAGYLTCVAPLPGFDPGPVAALVQDPAATGLRAAQSRNGSDLAVAALERDHLLGAELAGHPSFTRRVGEFVDLLHTRGPAAAAAEAAAATTPTPTSEGVLR
jgi:fructuronate reductase